MAPLRWLVAVLLVASACTSSPAATTDAVTPTTSPPSTQAASTTVPTGTAPPAPVSVPEVALVGPEEMVFDWSEEACEPEHIPDIASRAFRDADGMVQLIIGHYVNYRMIGPSLDEVVTDCSGPVLRSDFDPDPSQFNDSEWITSPHTFDGETVYAIVHNEYRGDTHDAVRPDQCPSSDRFTCLDTSVTMVVSRDGGDTYDHIAPPPGHMVATLPYVFDDEGIPSGLRQPSNIVRGPDGYFYVFTNASDYPDQEQWVCAMRTDDLDDPRSWRYWTGSDFSGVFIDPYTAEGDGATCAPLAPEQLSPSLQEAVVFDEVLGKYVMFGTADAPASGGSWGVYYSLSDDLVTWTSRQLLVELPSYSSVGDFDNDGFYAYVSVLDPESPSMSFDVTDGSAYLYITRFNAGTASLDRDLVRFPIEFRFTDVEPPEWTFGTDAEGWVGVNAADITVRDDRLVVTVTGDDPYLIASPLRIPAAFDRISIRMKVPETEEDFGQLFFSTDDVAEYTENTSIIFELIADGEFHDYVLDMSTVPAWGGLITSLRLDPKLGPGGVVEIDHISFG